MGQKTLSGVDKNLSRPTPFSTGLFDIVKTLHSFV